MGAGLQVGHPRPDGDDFTGALDARQVRRPRATCEGAAGLRDVGEVDPGGGNTDQDGTWSGVRYRYVGDQTQVRWAVQRRRLQGAHGGGAAHGNRVPLLGRSRSICLHVGRPGVPEEGIGPGRPKASHPAGTNQVFRTPAMSRACGTYGPNPKAATNPGSPKAEIRRMPASVTVSTQIPYGC